MAEDKGKEQKKKKKKKKSKEEEAPSRPLRTPQSRLVGSYRDEIIPAMMKEFGYKNRHQVPRLEKIALNVSMGEAIQNIKVLDGAAAELKAISGQKPVITRARKDISACVVRTHG